MANHRDVGRCAGDVGVSALRSETIRWQDSHMRRINNTSKIIGFYNNEIRKLVIVFMREFDKEAVRFKPKSEKSAEALRMQIQFQLDLATRLELATILHLLDHLGWLLRQTSYLYREEILYSIASELKRLLLNEQYEVVIMQLLRHSSLRNLDYLVEKIKELPTHDAK